VVAFFVVAFFVVAFFVVAFFVVAFFVVAFFVVAFFVVAFFVVVRRQSARARPASEQAPAGLRRCRLCCLRKSSRRVTRPSLAKKRNWRGAHRRAITLSAAPATP
jgi:Ca2+/Na+ antiporter